MMEGRCGGTIVFQQLQLISNYCKREEQRLGHSINLHWHWSYISNIMSHPAGRGGNDANHNVYHYQAPDVECQHYADDDETILRLYRNDREIAGLTVGLVDTVDGKCG